MVLRRFKVKGVGQFFAREQMTFFDLWGNIDIKALIGSYLYCMDSVTGTQILPDFIWFTNMVETQQISK